MGLGGLIVLYLRTLRRVPARGVVNFPLLRAAAEAATYASPIRRHLAAAAFMLAIAVAIIGAAGPIIPWPAPTGWPVVLMIDVSRSMRVALVSFGNYSTLVVPLTADRARVQDGIRNLSVQLRTQLGNGLMEGVRAMAGEQAAATAPVAPAVPVAPDPPRPDAPRAVGVLLTDGRASDGIPPLEAAQGARRQGMRVYTVGIGTAADPRTFRSGYFGVLDEPTLQAIASETGGEYFHAAETGRLRTIYRDLARVVGWERRPLEGTAVVAGIAMALLVASVVLRSWFAPI